MKFFSSRCFSRRLHGRGSAQLASCKHAPTECPTNALEVLHFKLERSFPILFASAAKAASFKCDRLSPSQLCRCCSCCSSLCLSPPHFLVAHRMSCAPSSPLSLPFPAPPPHLCSGLTQLPLLCLIGHAPPRAPLLLPRLTAATWRRLRRQRGRWWLSTCLLMVFGRGVYCLR